MDRYTDDIHARQGRSVEQVDFSGRVCAWACVGWIALLALAVLLG